MSSNLAINETLILSEEVEAKKLKLKSLYKNIESLKEEITSKILKDLKQCRKSCNDANTIIGELNGAIKKHKH